VIRFERRDGVPNRIVPNRILSRSPPLRLGMAAQPVSPRLAICALGLSLMNAGLANGCVTLARAGSRQLALGLYCP
jgi:hypothetical protein